MKDIPVTDIYVLFNEDEGLKDCHDIAVLILREPVTHEGKIVPGIDFNKLNVIADKLNIENEWPFHIDLNGERPLVIGYGITGLESKPNLEINSLISSEKKLQSLLGSNIKKAIVVRGLDLNEQGIFQQVQGCMCSRRAHRDIKQILERIADIPDEKQNTFLEIQKVQEINDAELKKFHYNSYKEVLKALQCSLEKEINEARKALSRLKEKKDLYCDPCCGDGFSGSLILKKSDDESENYDVFGIFSGPLFTGEIKNFVGNAARHHATGSPQASMYPMWPMEECWDQPTPKPYQPTQKHHPTQKASSGSRKSIMSNPHQSLINSRRNITPHKKRLRSAQKRPRVTGEYYGQLAPEPYQPTKKRHPSRGRLRSTQKRLRGHGRVL